MAMGTLGMEIKHKGLLLFGTILLLIGLVAYFYYYDPHGWETRRVYPYQSIGMVLVLAGIIFVAIGFFYSPRKRLS